MSLYTSTVITPRKPSRAWVKFAESTAYALGLPILLLIIWGCLLYTSPSPRDS